MVMQGLFNI